MRKELPITNKANDELGECEARSAVSNEPDESRHDDADPRVAFLVHGPDESRNDDAKPQGRIQGEVLHCTVWGGVSYSSGSALPDSEPVHYEVFI